MRADRLLSILLLLQVHGRITARELARRLEVSERTIHRDMEALSVAGVPVVAERGSGGGWQLLEAYRTDLTGLNPSEIQALFLTHSARLLTDLGLNKAAEAALVKLLAALPAVHRRDAEYAHQRIHIDATGWYRGEEAVPLLAALQEGIWQERKLHLTYQRGDGAIVERLVDPLGLVAKGNVWYVVAGVEDGIRTYRVSRIQAVKLTNQSCIRPSNFDLAAYWSQASVDFKACLPQYPAMLRVASAALPRLRHARYTRIEHEQTADSAGWSIVAVQFEVEEQACEYVLSCGPQVEVVEPQALRDKVILLTEQTLALYKQHVPLGSPAVD